VNRSDFPALKKQLWVIIARPVGDGAAAQAILPDHLRHQAELEKQGVLFGAGPLTEPASGKRISLIIIRAQSEAHARQIADTDPMHKAGARTYELYEWSLNEGGLGVKINFAEGTFKFD
jgi:uncharacterized protein